MGGPAAAESFRNHHRDGTTSADSSNQNAAAESLQAIYAADRSAQEARRGIGNWSPDTINVEGATGAIACCNGTYEKTGENGKLEWIYRRSNGLVVRICYSQPKSRWVIHKGDPEHPEYYRERDPDGNPLQPPKSGWTRRMDSNPEVDLKLEYLHPIVAMIAE